MDKWLKLHVIKKLLNLGVATLNRLLPDREPKFPQTQMLEGIYREFFRAYRVEAFCGSFDDVPCQTLKGLKDRHFLNLLALSRKVLFYLGDMDRYYRQWLGLFFLLVHDEIDMQQRNMTFEGFLASTWAQWNFDMHGAFSREYFEKNKRLFQEILLANNLCNLCSKALPGFDPWEPRIRLA